MRHCNKCGERHEPPTGKKCNRDRQPEDLPQPTALATTLQALQTGLQNIQLRLSKLEDQDKESLDSSPSPDQDKGTGDAPVLGATATTLQHDGGLQSQVAARLATLLHQHPEEEEPDLAGKSTKSKKSGRAKTANDFVLCDIDWPHYYVYRGQNRKPAAYEELSVTEFVLGFCHMLILQKHAGASQCHMLRLLCDMMEDASEFGWPSVRNFYAVLTNQIEMKRATWTDSATIQQLRVQYAQKYTKPSSYKKPKPTTPYCTAYQEDKCDQTGDHSSDTGFVKHICSYCLRITSQHYAHPESQCRRKERHAKNGAAEASGLPQ